MLWYPLAGRWDFGGGSCPRLSFNCFLIVASIQSIQDSFPDMLMLTTLFFSWRLKPPDHVNHKWKDEVFVCFYDGCVHMIIPGELFRDLNARGVSFPDYWWRLTLYGDWRRKLRFLFAFYTYFYMYMYMQIPRVICSKGKQKKSWAELLIKIHPILDVSLLFLIIWKLTVDIFTIFT